MNCRYRTIACCLSTLLVFAWTAPAWAQQPARPKTAEAAQPAAEKPAAKAAAAKPAAKPAAEKPAAGAEKKTTEAAEQPNEDESRGDSGVAAILATKPSTPVDCTRAATILSLPGIRDPLELSA